MKIDGWHILTIKKGKIVWKDKSPAIQALIEIVFPDFPFIKSEKFLEAGEEEPVFSSLAFEVLGGPMEYAKTLALQGIELSWVGAVFVPCKSLL